MFLLTYLDKLPHPIPTICPFYIDWNKHILKLLIDYAIYLSKNIFIYLLKIYHKVYFPLYSF
jgi:hypothetical protein